MKGATVGTSLTPCCLRRTSHTEPVSAPILTTEYAWLRHLLISQAILADRCGTQVRVFCIGRRDAVSCMLASTTSKRRRARRGSGPPAHENSHSQVSQLRSGRHCARILPMAARWYHGTSAESARAIQAVGFQPSRNPYDWLGDGVYFFQDGEARARSWASERWPHAAVVEAQINLDSCLDLLDPAWFQILSEAYDVVVASYASRGEALPRQQGLVHGMDRIVINYACAVLDDAGTHVTTVRGAFQEGRPAFPGSALATHAHVQVAVRDLTAIESFEIKYLGGTK